MVLQVLDARDPAGTRSPYLERYMRSQHAHKHLVLLLNKVDLVPTWVTVRITNKRVYVCTARVLIFTRIQMRTLLKKLYIFLCRRNGSHSSRKNAPLSRFMPASPILMGKLR